MVRIANGLEAETKLRYVSPDVLDFDPTNPRFGGLMDDRNQEEIQQALFNEPYYASELVDSLLANGFIDYEPLVVRRNGRRFTVVEGNRRLAAIREIRANPTKYSGRKSDLDEIPVLVFPERPDEQQQNEMRVYLGVRHLLGFREWPPLSKAQFLQRESGMPGGLERVIKEMRITKTQARRFLIPFRLLHAADVKIPKGEDFWVLGEALGRSGIKKFLQLEVDPKSLEVVSYNKQKLASLLSDLYGPKDKKGTRDSTKKVVFDTRDLSRLASVLGSDAATSVLHSGKTLEEAEIYVNTREQSLSRLEKVTKDLGMLVRKVVARSKDASSVALLASYKRFAASVKSIVKRREDA